MKPPIILAFLLISVSASAQLTTKLPVIASGNTPVISMGSLPKDNKKDIQVQPEKWKINRNQLVTGGLAFIAGASKGFNETLQFHWKEFHRQFPRANAQWFNPAVSWKNKYKDGDSQAGARYPLSTSVLIMFTDQYHLNNFINKMSWTSALVIKIGEGKRPFKHYLLDFLYYTICHQAGFAATYYPFSKYKGK